MRLLFIKSLIVLAEAAPMAAAVRDLNSERHHGEQLNAVARCQLVLQLVGHLLRHLVIPVLHDPISGEQNLLP